MADKRRKSDKGGSGHVSKSGQGLTVTYRPKKKRKRTTLPLTDKFFEEFPERKHWMLRFKKKEG
jgi:hypothetical protein